MSHTEQLVKLSRRQLWFAFAFIVLLGLMAIVPLAWPEAQTPARQLWGGLPIVIIIAAGSLHRSMKKAGSTSGKMQAVLDDELRHASMHRAYRNGFFAMLVLQPVLSFAITGSGIANPLALMAAVSAVAGAAVALASLLYYDR
jgi:hypothetical protein